MLPSWNDWVAEDANLTVTLQKELRHNGDSIAFFLATEVH